MKRKLALLIVAVLLLGLFAGCKSGPTKGTNPAEPVKVKPADIKQDKELVISVMFSNHDSQPYTEATWLLPKKAKEKFNIKMDMKPIPSADFLTKRNTAIQTNEMYDLIMGVDKALIDKEGKLGRFLNTMMYASVMPNMVAAMEKYPLIKLQMPSPTEMYSQPAQITTDGAVNTAAYFMTMARFDVMEKLGLEPPKTFDDLYNLLKAFKDNDPNCYPWGNRQSFDMLLSVFAPGLGICVFPSGTCNTGYGVWNDDTKKFTHIMDEPNFKYFIEFLNKLYKDGLLDPDYAADTTQQWEAKIVSGSALFAVDYFARPDMMSTMAQKSSPGYDLNAMLPPALPEGQQKTFARLGIGSWFAIDTRTKDPARLCNFIDWWRYTEEGSLLTTYGVKDETYKVNADKTMSRIYSEGIGSDLDFDAAYGTNYLQFWSFRPDFYGHNLADPNASKWNQATWNLQKDSMIPSPPTIVRNEAELAEYSEYATDMTDEIRKNFNEMVMGRTPITDWDKVKQAIDDAGYAKFLEQLNRIYAAQK